MVSQLFKLQYSAKHAGRMKPSDSKSALQLKYYLESRTPLITQLIKELYLRARLSHAPAEATTHLQTIETVITKVKVGPISTPYYAKMRWERMVPVHSTGQQKSHRSRMNLPELGAAEGSK
jgi:hypothetical protein